MPKLYCKDCDEVIKSDVEKGDVDSHDHGVSIPSEIDEDSEDQESEGEESEDSEQDEEIDPEEPEGIGSDGLDEDELDEMMEDAEGEMEEEEGLDSEEEQKADEMEEALKAAGAGPGGSIKLRNNPRRDPSTDRISEAERRANGLEKIIKDEFRQRKRTGMKRNRKAGTFDADQMIDASRGSARVFKRRTKPEDPDFHAVILLDESGSMSGNDIMNASMATGMLACAFENSGIDTDVYRFEDDAHLVKSHVESWHETSDLVMDSGVGGGTRLLDALGHTEDLIEERGATNPVVITITDGRPSRSNSCEEKISEMQATTLCLEIGGYGRDFTKSFDGYSVVTESSEIERKIEGMFRAMLLK